VVQMIALTGASARLPQAAHSEAGTPPLSPVRAAVSIERVTADLQKILPRREHRRGGTGARPPGIIFDDVPETQECPDRLNGDLDPLGLFARLPGWHSS
jgi:hypothetical protein